MKNTGIVREVDKLGRIVLPKELRNEFYIHRGDPLEIYVTEDSVILKKYQRGCVLCGSIDQLVEFKGKKICRECIDRYIRDIE